MKYYIVNENWVINGSDAAAPKENMIGVFSDYRDALACFMARVSIAKKEAESNSYDAVEEELDKDRVDKYYVAWKEGSYTEDHIEVDLIDKEVDERSYLGTYYNYLDQMEAGNVGNWKRTALTSIFGLDQETAEYVLEMWEKENENVK